MINIPLTEQESIIGKRLRVTNPQHCSSDWVEGKIFFYDLKTGKHAIVYDDDTIVCVHLKTLDYEWKNDQGQKAVEKLDLKTGEVLETFRSISDAASSISGASGGNLSAVIRGNSMSSYGFFWRYKGSSVLPPKPKRKKKICQICLNTGRVIETFDSIVDAGNAVGIATPGISYCCNGRNSAKSAGGFGWQFAIEN